MVYGPRRYGKTSLARAVEGRAREEYGIPGIYVDLWGTTSISDIVSVLGQAYARASVAFRMRRFLADLLSRLGFTVSFEGASVGVNYEGAGRGRREREVLMELLRVPQRMSSQAASGRVLVILDEFGEVLNMPGEPDALMRSAFQDSPDVSFLFMGSKRSLMDGLFSDRRRPFYNFGRRIELSRLSYEDLGTFVEERFENAARRITSEAVDVLLGLGQGHPYRTQQLAFHAFRLSGTGRRSQRSPHFESGQPVRQACRVARFGAILRERCSTLMRAITLWSAIIGSVLVLLAGCANSSSQEQQKAYTPHIDPADFTTKVDNEYFPMKPGTTFIYEGGSERGEMTVTQDTRTIMGVECIVVDHKEWDGGKLIERTYDWYAQDDKGTVWYFGEDTKEYENGEVVSTKGSWEAGVDGAKPGIIMQADPKVGHSYHQEYSPGEAMDKARVVSFEAWVRVPYGTFDEVLETREWTPLQPGFSEKKYYVRGVGHLGNPADLGLVAVKHG